MGIIVQNNSIELLSSKNRLKYWLNIIEIKIFKIIITIRNNNIIVKSWKKINES